jgi:Kef-type K+ transport system membrane component KefB
VSVIVQIVGALMVLVGLFAINAGMRYEFNSLFNGGGLLFVGGLVVAVLGVIAGELAAIRRLLTQQKPN